MDMDVRTRHNVRATGRGLDAPAIVFAHGFGCDQNMWRFVAPAFEDRFHVVLFDHIGAGGSDLSAYDPERHASLGGYADDVVRLIEGLGLRDVAFVGHSVSAMIGALAANRSEGLIGRLIMVGPSPRYIDDGDYRGGFAQSEIDELLEVLDANHMGWSAAMAPTIMGNADRPELGEELTNSFCRTDPAIAKQFARTTFTSDNRADLEAVSVPTLVLQCRDDAIANEEVGRFVHEHIAGSQFTMLDASGHCPNLSAPEETTKAIAAFV